MSRLHGALNPSASRRRWLCHAGATALTGIWAPGTVWAAGASDARFLFVMLRGGMDGLSLLVPHRSELYAQARPQIRIPLRSATGDAAGADLIDEQWALHPAWAASVGPLVRAGHCSFVPFAGVDNLSRSHFETQDSVEMGHTSGTPRNYRSGFLNRLAHELAGVKAMAFTDALPLALRGSAPVQQWAMRGPLSRPAALPLERELQSMYRDHPLDQRVQGAMQMRAEVASQFSQEMELASRQALSTRGFEAEARRIARLMRQGFQIGFVDVGGWDTHIGQGAATGYLANQLRELGLGLAAFAQEMGESVWRRTVVVVATEFGRTLRENGGRGTDHGHGSVAIVLGGSLRGTPVCGEQLPIEARWLHQNRDLPVLNPLPSVLGGLLAQQYGLSADALGRIFPGAPPRDVGLA